jgi:ribonuclease HI
LEARPDGRVRATHALLRGCLSRRVNESTHAELMAVLLALHLAATDRDGETWNQPIHILTDSVPALHHIRRGLAKNITPNIKYRAVITAIVASILARPQPTVCRHVKGHAGNHGNELADRLALIGRNIPAHDGTDADADDSPSYKHAGAITLRRTLLPGMHALTRTIHTDLNELMGASDWWDAGVATPK